MKAKILDIEALKAVSPVSLLAFGHYLLCELFCLLSGHLVDVGEV